jgi:hypothetical protein
MAELVRCKSCGYVMEAGKLGEVCPACGVPRKMMEPWKDPVSERRRFALGFDAHPILDHFSVSFATCAFALSLFVLVFPFVVADAMTLVLQVFAGILPLAVIASFVSGLVDGKVRFRRTTTPLLRRKQLLGIVFFVGAAAGAAVSILAGSGALWARLVDAVALGVGFAAAVLLGRIGKGLLTAIFPG